MLCKDIYAEWNKWARHHLKILHLMDLIHDCWEYQFVIMLIKTYQILYLVGINHCVFWQNLVIVLWCFRDFSLQFPRLIY